VLMVVNAILAGEAICVTAHHPPLCCAVRT
jgi:hypothetical protein